MTTFGRCTRNDKFDDLHGCSCAVDGQFEYLKTVCEFWRPAAAPIPATVAPPVAEQAEQDKRH